MTSASELNRKIDALENGNQSRETWNTKYVALPHGITKRKAILMSGVDLGSIRIDMDKNKLIMWIKFTNSDADKRSIKIDPKAAFLFEDSHINTHLCLQIKKMRHDMVDPKTGRILLPGVFNLLLFWAGMAGVGDSKQLAPYIRGLGLRDYVNGLKAAGKLEGWYSGDHLLQ